MGPWDHARGGGSPRLAGRALVVALLLPALLAVQVPAHEYAHCALSWARGGPPVCEVAYARPGTVVQGPGSGLGDAARAEVGPLPWWEHPVLYGAHVLFTLAVAWRAGRYLAETRPRGA